MAKNKATEATGENQSAETLDKRVDRLEKMVAFLERKRQEYRDNWKVFSRTHVNTEGDGTMGQIGSVRLSLLSLMAVLCLALPVFGEWLGHLDDGSGNAKVEYELDSSGRYNGNMRLGGSGGTGTMTAYFIGSVVSNQTGALITSNATVNGTMTIAGAITFNGDLDINGDLTCSNTTWDGGSTINGGDNDISNLGRLHIDALQADGTSIEITNDVDLIETGGSTGSANLDVAGYSQFADTLEADGDILADGNITGDGSTILSNAVIHGCTIGAVEPLAGAFTTVTASGDITANGNVTGDGATILSNVLIHGCTIGAVEPLAGAFTTVSASGDITANGNLTGDGATIISNAVIHGCTIGAAEPLAGAFTTISASGDITANGNVTGDGATIVSNAVIHGCTIGAVEPLAGAFTTVTASGDITANGNVTGDGATILSNVVIHGSTIGAVEPLAGAFTTVSASGDISANGNVTGDGATIVSNAVIHGCTIGAVEPLSGAFTTISASGDITANGNVTGDGATIVSNAVIHGCTIGAAEPLAGAFTTVSASGDISANGNITGDGVTIISNAVIHGCTIGAVEPLAGAFTSLSATGDLTVEGGDITGSAGCALDMGEVAAQRFTFSVTNNSGEVVIAARDDDNNASIQLSAGGQGVVTIGGFVTGSGATNTSVRVETDGTGDTEFVVPDKCISGTEIGDETITASNLAQDVPRIGDTSNTNQMFQSGSVTMHSGTIWTQTFDTAYAASSVPIVVVTHTEAEAEPPVITTAASNLFHVTVTASKNFNWIAIGRKP